MSPTTAIHTQYALFLSKVKSISFCFLCGSSAPANLIGVGTRKNSIPLTNKRIDEPLRMSIASRQWKLSSSRLKNDERAIVPIPAPERAMPFAMTKFFKKYRLRTNIDDM